MPDNPEKSASPHPEKDRRLHARQRIHSLSYVKMGDANGGIVLNISEGGISVQAAAALDPSEPVTMWLEIPRVRNRVEVTAEIVWLSASKKEAGLRFVDLPESMLQQIRRWMAREASPEQFEDETDPVGEEQDEPVEVRQGEDTEVRELAEANIVTHEIKSFESQHDSAGRPATAEAEENEEDEDGEAESQTPEVAEIEADQWEDVEAEEDIDEESEPEVEPETEAEVELHGKIHDEAETKTKVEIQDESQDEDKSRDEKESQTEDELIQAFGPPVVPFERRPHAPFSSMNAIAGGSRSAQNLAVAPPLPRQIQKPVAEPAMSIEPAAESSWKVFRIQLQSGWFLAALVLLLALISFIAGMAVRRGALNNVLGEQQDALIPKSSTAPGAISHTTPPASGDAADDTNVPPAKPLSIEIVDMSDHRWVIPASTGANHASASVTAEAPGTSPAGGANHVKGAGADAEAQGSSQPTANAGSGRAAPVNPGKTVVPLVLSLPETPISATGSVAISSQRSVPVPADGPKAAQNGRSLQVGQLINLVEPVYPAEAVQQKIEGTVKLHAVIGTDGVIESLAQVSGPQVLVNASMTAVRNWKYSPTRMNGQPIETQEDISFVFRLPN
jgi:TonB family protein